MRIRTIKPDFWLNERIARLSEKTQLVAIALLNYADDEGYFNAHPEVIRGQLFPYDKDSRRITVALTELSNIDYLRIGTADDGRKYGWVVGFLKHQRINNASKSKIKDLCLFTEDYVSPTVALTEDVHGELEGKGNKEGNGTSAAPAKPARARNELFDALAAVSGADPKELTADAQRACGVALAQIQKASPAITPDEIKRRAENYRTHFDNAALTPNALAKHWATCGKASTRRQSAQQKPDRTNFKTDPGYADLQT